jgi:hypothetical protein
MMDNEISIGNFFEHNSRLFVVIGVFSALSVYFTTFLSTSGNREKTTIYITSSILFNPLEYVIVACFIIVLMIILVLLKQITYDEKGDFFPIHYWIGFNAIKRLILIFTLIMISLGIVSTIILVYSQLIFPISMLLSTFFGFTTFITVFILWAKFYHQYTNNDPAGCVSLFCFSIFMIFIIGILDLVISKILIQEIALLLAWYLGIIASGVILFLFISIPLCLTRLIKILIKNKNPS